MSLDPREHDVVRKLPVKTLKDLALFSLAVVGRSPLGHQLNGREAFIYSAAERALEI